MRIEVLINGNNNPVTNYITWAPANCQIIVTDPEGATDPVPVRLRNQDTNQGGQVVFYEEIPGNEQDELELDLPVDGTPVDFFIAGKFGFPSLADKDAAIEVLDTNFDDVVSVTSLMVRIRKNANNLTTQERDRFLFALATLNDRGMGRFSDFRAIHTSAGDREAHYDSGFLPWHRSYLLDLERELQQVDPSVSLPYWKFDQPAQNLFTRDFIGIPNPIGTLEFSPGNPLQFWVTDMSTGIVRQPRFNTMMGSAFVSNEEATIVLGSRYSDFRIMELNPHSFAHSSFTGFISELETAAKDPLFFMLHANVDRLWAKWQWINRRYDLTSVDTFDRLGSAGDFGSTRVGHNLNDTMWPWNQIIFDMDGVRPDTAPGGDLAASLITNAPGPIPRVADMIDYQGVLNPGSRLGFDYDDVPFQF